MSSQVTLVGTSQRSFDWLMRLYNSVKTNLEFDVVWVGPKIPEEPLPSNVEYIHATTKRAQCVHIGLSHVKGETWCFVGDDIEFEPYALDDGYQIYKESNDYKTVVGFRSIVMGVDITDAFAENPNGLFKYIPCSIGITSTQFLRELGGIHKHFTFHAPEYEFYLRAYKAGMKLKMSKFAWHEYATLPHGENPNNQFRPKQDFDVLRSRWAALETFVLELAKFEPFEDNDTIYTVNQGQTIERPKEFVTTETAPPSTIWPRERTVLSGHGNPLPLS